MNWIKQLDILGWAFCVMSTKRTRFDRIRITLGGDLVVPIPFGNSTWMFWVEKA